MDTHGRRLGQRMAAELRAEMARQGRSRRWLAETIGESHVTVGRWVKGETPMSLDSVDAMCRALGLTVADLLSAVERNGGYEMTPLPREGGATAQDRDSDTHRNMSQSSRGVTARGVLVAHAA
jgi:transcriptional regulator with XRE-family HTH domain